MIKKILSLLVLTIPFAFVYGQYCPNDDFSNLNFDYWEAFTGVNTGGGAGCCPVPGLVPDRHTIITQTTVDTNTCGGLTVPPPGVARCARLGNANDGAQSERLIYHFTVDPANPAFIFRWAAVFEMGLYPKFQAPYFTYRLLNDSNNLVNEFCGFLELQSTTSAPPFHFCNGAHHFTAWDHWKTVGIDLSNYAGQNMHMEFTASDCSDGDNFGYAYISVECATMVLDQSFCQGTDTVVLTAPTGFSYLWNTGDTTQAIMVVNPVIGTEYTCKVSSSDNCFFYLSSTISATVMSPNFTFSHDSCSRLVSFTGTSSISSGNAFTSYWDFDDGSTSALNNPNHLFPGPGTYNVTLTIATIGGCDSSITKTVTIGNVPLAIFAAHDTCVNTAVIFHNYSYAQDSIVSWSWKFGDDTPLDIQNWNPLHIYAVPGKYTIKLTVTNARGCTDTISHVIRIYALPVADFSYSQPLCAGMPTTLFFTGNATPLTTYNWTFNGGTVLSGSGLGPYTVIWDNSGAYQVSLDIFDPICNSASNKTKTITINTLPVANAGEDTTICLGHSVMLQASGGNTYLWSPAATLNNSHIANPIASPTTQTTYIVTVSDNSCLSTDTVVVSIEELSPISVTPDTLICEGTKFYLHASGGSTYHWSPPTALSATNIPNPFCTTENTITYTVTITDNTGCTAIEDVTVTISGAINSSFNLTLDSICPGQNTSVYYIGGSINPYATYTWDFDGGNISFGSGMGPYSINWTTPGIHTITLTVSEAACDSSITVKTVKVNQGPAAEAGVNDTICRGESVQLHGSGGSVYSWYPTGSLNSSVIQNPIATPLVTTRYGLYVYSNGCLGHDTVTIWVWQLPEGLTSGDTSLCFGDTVVLNASGGLTYLWSPPYGLSSTTVSNPTAGPEVTTTYTVVTTDEHSCQSIDSLTVTINEKPSSLFIVDDSTICLGEEVAVTYTGNGTPDLTYSWDFNGATLLSGSGQGPYVITWPTPGNYSLSLSVNDGDCQSDLSVQSVSVFKVQADIGEYQDVQCYGNNNGMASVTVSGGSTPYTYLWNNLETTPSINNLTSGEYSVTVTDMNGCQDADTITITSPAAPLLMDPTYDDISCHYLCDGWISTNASGGTPPYAFIWNISPVDSALYNLCSGIYNVTVTDDHGCTALQTFNLEINTTVDASFMADVTSGFVPLSVNFNFTGTGATSLQWDFGDNSTSNLENPNHIYNTPGMYQVILIINSMDPDFCSDTMEISILAEDTSYITVPNVLTPNNDGYNDYFTVKSHYLDNITITIYNRWGTLVYSSDNEDIRWEGTSKDGRELPQGTYFYTLKAKGKDGRDYSYRGAITLLR